MSWGLTEGFEGNEADSKGREPLIKIVTYSELGSPPRKGLVNQAASLGEQLTTEAFKRRQAR